MYEIGNDEIEALKNLFSSRKLFRYQGNNKSQCELLERKFSSYLGRGNSLLVNTGTNALILSLHTLGIQAGDEVLVPSYAFIADIVAIQKFGAKPIVVNVDNNLSLDLQDAQNKITKQTKAMILVYMDGLFPKIENYVEFCQLNSLLLIEDVAQALGGEYQGKKLGSFGDASCFSFNVDKIITAGEGGLVNFKNLEAFKKALMLHDFPAKFGKTYHQYLADVDYELGYSMRVSEITAALLNVQLVKLPSIVNKLRMHRQALIEAAPHLPWIKASDDQNQASTQVLLKCQGPKQVAELTTQLLGLGIEALPLYGKPVHCFWQWDELIYPKMRERKIFEMCMVEQRIHLSSILKIPISYDANIFEKQIDFVKSLKLNN